MTSRLYYFTCSYNQLCTCIYSAFDCHNNDHVNKNIWCVKISHNYIIHSFAGGVKIGSQGWNWVIAVDSGDSLTHWLRPSDTEYDLDVTVFSDCNIGSSFTCMQLLLYIVTKWLIRLILKLAYHYSYKTLMNMTRALVQSNEYFTWTNLFISIDLSIACSL